MMFASAFLATAFSLVSSSGPATMFACSWVETPDDDPFFMDTVELVAERDRAAPDEVWHLQWADGRTAAAETRPLGTGQFGDRVRLEWTEGSDPKQAFVSYLPEIEVGREMVLITFDDGQLEQPPGFVCLTAPLEEVIE
jgi:hypothetical protein